MHGTGGNTLRGNIEQEKLTMQQRGKILRDTHSGTGLIIVDGRQHAFTLEGIWRSSEAPAVNMTVDAQFDETGTLTALFAVPDAQLAREKTDEAMAARVQYEIDDVQRSEDVNSKWAELEAKVLTHDLGEEA